MDSIKDLAARPGGRDMYFHWLAEESDVELCTHLWQPRHLAPPRSWTLGHPRLQTLCLLDALAGKGFVCEGCVSEHDPETPRLAFDSRKPVTKQAYLRCVIAAAGLLAAGVTSCSRSHSTRTCCVTANYHLTVRQRSNCRNWSRAPTLKNSLWCRRL